MDDFPEDLTEVVNDHWRQFPPQHPLYADIAGICFLILTTICLSTNFLIIYSFLTSKDLRTPVIKFDYLFFHLIFLQMTIFSSNQFFNNQFFK